MNYLLTRSMEKQWKTYDIVYGKIFLEDMNMRKL